MWSPAKSQNTEKTDQETQTEFLEKNKTDFEKYIASDDMKFFERALERLHEDEYIRQNINTFMDATVGKLTTKEEQILWKALIINQIFPDSARNLNYIIRTTNMELELANFFDIYRSWRFDYRKYLIQEAKKVDRREKWKSSQRSTAAKLLRKSDHKKPNYKLETLQIENYLEFAKDFVKENYPQDAETMLACIKYCQEDEYIKINLEKIMAQNLSKIMEKEKWIATLEALSIITEGLVLEDWTTIQGSFTTRNHIKLSAKTNKQISNFLTDFSTFASKYIKYSKTRKIRKF